MICDHDSLASDSITSLVLLKGETIVAKTEGNTHFCFVCYDTPDKLVRMLWSLTGMRCDVSLEDITAFVLVYRSGKQEFVPKHQAFPALAPLRREETAAALNAMLGLDP